MSAAARFVPARAPNSAALLEAPARVVAEAPAAASVGVLHEARLVHLHVAPGDVVEPGSPIADVFIPAVAEAAADIGPLSAQLQATRSRINALEALQKEGLARAESLFDLRARAEELTRARRRAEAILSAYGFAARDASSIRPQGILTLRSPVSGVVVERTGTIGAVTGPLAPPIARVAGPRPARIEASLTAPVPEEATLVFVGQDGGRVLLASTPMSSFRDGPSGRVTVWLKPKEPVALPDGLAGRVRIDLPGGAVEVPHAAVGRDEAGPFVRVLDDTGEVRRVDVRVLLDSGAVAVVTGELAPGASVAARVEAEQ